ncbi:MAG: hypothetical protein WAL97_01335 [Halobacteriota archaeon]
MAAGRPPLDGAGDLQTPAHEQYRSKGEELCVSNVAGRAVENEDLVNLPTGSPHVSHRG